MESSVKSSINDFMNNDNQEPKEVFKACKGDMMPPLAQPIISGINLLVFVVAMTALIYRFKNNLKSRLVFASLAVITIALLLEFVISLVKFLYLALPVSQWLEVGNYASIVPVITLIFHLIKLRRI